MANIFDGLMNMVSRLGTGGDRNTQNVWAVKPISQAQLEASYRSSWMTRKVVDLLPFEMTRAGRDWQAEADQITQLEAQEARLALWLKIREALSTARLHGGAALIMGVRQGLPDQPLNIEALQRGQLQYCFVASRFQLETPRGMETDIQSPYFGEPAMYRLRNARGSSVDIHPSRVIPFHGAPLPPGALTLSQRDRFWGDSVLVAIQQAIDNAEVSQAAIASLLHELKQDVLSIPELTEQITTQNSEALLAKRIEAVSYFKSMFNVLLLDGGNGKSGAKEEWTQKQINFSQHPELLRQFAGFVAGASGLPVTVFLGETPGGLNSTGKGERQELARAASALQTADLKPALARIDEILIPCTLGSRPEEIYSEFSPLLDADPVQESEIEKREMESVQILQTTGLIRREALGAAVRNRLIESGRWPGLDQANETTPDLPEPEVVAVADRLQRGGAITRAHALRMVTDAAPRTLYVARPVVNGREILAWAKKQGFAETLEADDLHVTIIYSKTPVDWMKAGTAWEQDENGRLTLPPGGPRIVEALGDKGAVVLHIPGDRLRWRHDSLKGIGATHTFPEYQPHITLTYAKPEGLDLATVEPYTGPIILGPERFEEVKEDWGKSRNAV